MIRDVLEKPFVHEFGRRLADAFDQPDTDRRRGGEKLPEGAEELTDDDYVVAGQELARALKQEGDAQGGTDAQQESDAERDDTAPGADEDLYVSREPAMGILQAAIEEFYETLRSGDIETSAASPRREGSAGIVTDRRLKRQEGTGRRLLRKFEETDARWIKCWFALAVRKLRGKHAFNEKPTRLSLAGDSARLYLVGDWGSGIPRAQAVAEKMQSRMTPDRSVPQYAIHLGDIYYAGTPRECQKRFLNHWPVKPEWAGAIGSLTLNGNHDMYAGGYGYFDTVLAEERFRRQEGSSLFCLSNAHWRILGLDTAWIDEELADPQPAWIGSEVQQARAEGQKVLFLSHHQLFSAHEEVSGEIEAQLRYVLGGPGVDAWFWGHEHRCTLYKPNQGVRFARCLGHGGVPVWMRQKPEDPLAEPAIYEYRGAIDRGLESFAKFGFAVLDLEGPNIAVRYISEDGEEHHSETIS